VLTLGRAAGSADVDSVALVPRSEPEGRVFKLGGESRSPDMRSPSRALPPGEKTARMRHARLPVSD